MNTNILEALENKLFYIIFMAALTYLYSLYYIFEGDYLYVITLKFFTMAIYSVVIIYLAHKSNIEKMMRIFAIGAIIFSIIPLGVGVFNLFSADSNSILFQSSLAVFVPGLIILNSKFIKETDVKKIIRVALRFYFGAILIGFIHVSMEGKNHSIWAENRSIWYDSMRIDGPEPEDRADFFNTYGDEPSYFK